LKFAIKYGKTIKKNIKMLTDSWAPRVKGSYVSATQRQSAGFDRRLLADGEVSGGSVTTTTLYSPSRIEGYPRLARRLVRSMLSCGHGGSAAMRGGAPAVFGCNRLKKVRQQLRGDLSDLSGID
jgi:hypothetical protein